MRHNSNIPRAVSREYFYQICPESEITVLKTEEIQKALGSEATVSQIVDRWVSELKSIDSRCVEFSHDSPALFSYM